MSLNGGGYTFLNPYFFHLLTDGDVQRMFTERSSFLMRTRNTDSTLYSYNILTQLSQYSYAN